MSTIVMPEMAPADTLHETVNGERREGSHLSPLGAMVASLLLSHLHDFTLGRKRGVMAVKTLFRLREKPRLERRPHLAFVADDRLTAPFQPPDGRAAWDIVPNLAVEVITPTITVDDLVDKISDYFAHGVALVWVVYPRQRLIYVYQSRFQLKVLNVNGTLDRSSVTTSFALKVSDLFGALVKP